MGRIHPVLTAGKDGVIQDNRTLILELKNKVAAIRAAQQEAFVAMNDLISNWDETRGPCPVSLRITEEFYKHSKKVTDGIDGMTEIADDASQMKMF